MCKSLIERVGASRVRGIFRVLGTAEFACFDVHVDDAQGITEPVRGR